MNSLIPEEIKPFARQGHFTTIDNAVLDIIMPSLSGSSWKILCFIIRKTIGYQKEVDGISYSQIKNGTGIGSYTTIKKSLDDLLNKGIVQQGKTDSQTDPHYYRLNRDYTCRATENVEQPITFSVARPTTESVDTKESINKNKKKVIAPNGASLTLPPSEGREPQKLNGSAPTPPATI